MTTRLVSTLDQISIGTVAITARAVTAAGADLTFVQWRLILIVGDSEVGATVNQIAVRLGAHPSPTSRLVSRLVRRGLAESVPDRTDARARRIRLTDAGRNLREKVLDLRRGVLAEIIEASGIEPRDLDVLDRLAGAFGAYA